MARRGHCPYCSTPDKPSIVELPHSCPEHQAYLATFADGETPSVYQGPRDIENRPIGEAVKPSGERVPGRARKGTETQHD